jgi:hypothetical protein
MATCCKCGSEFKRKRDKSGYCPSCKSAYDREHYLNNKAAYVARNTAAKARLRYENTKRLNEVLQSRPCVDCGERDPIVLEFDHRGDKENDVSILLGLSWKLVALEIAKCDVRCANCYRRVTAKRANWTRHRLNEQ